jgi:hypothetical protein
MNPQLIPVLAALGGAALGMFGSFLPTYTLECFKKKEESRSTTSAILTEIRVTLELFRHRQYLNEIESILEQFRQDKTPDSTFQVVMPETCYPIFKSQVGKIGLLPEHLRDDVVTFYQFLEAVICDVKPGGTFSVPRDKHFFECLFEISKETVRIGEQILAKDRS